MNNLPRISALVISAAALLFGGCATPSKSTEMVAALAAPVTKHPQTLSVKVSGGSETSKMGASKISDDDFAEAIRASITQAGLFSKISPAEASDYNLDVQIVRLDQPMVGLAMTVTMEATWRLTKRNNQQVVWQKAVVTPFTAKMGDAFAGVTRLRLANEGAARENIKEAIGQMGALTLP